MSEKDKHKVRNWPQVSTRIDPDIKDKFNQKLKENGDDKSEVIRRAIRDYTKRS